MRSETLSEPEIALKNDPRLSDHWIKRPWSEIEKLAPFQKALKQVAILSYPDDEGVRLNNGRAGAHRGPERILHFLGRMVNRGRKTPPIIVVSDSSRLAYLEKRHEEAEQKVLHLLKLNCRVITLGGGHDYGFPDAAAYYQFTQGKILNIDAHLDVRPVLDGRLNSGTPFFRFIQRFGGKPLVEWGIQSQCNALSHFAFAKKAGAKILDETKSLPKLQGEVGLSVCLDAFAGIRGVSAPCFSGLSTRQGLDAVETFKEKSRWLGIYESAPEFDPLNEDSARFGALLAYRFIHIL
jgi:formiminoglutamase